MTGLTANTESLGFPYMTSTNKSDVEPIMLRARDAAKLLGVSEGYWKALNRRGQTPKPVRIGGAVRWRRDEIMAWIDDGAPPRVEPEDGD